MNMSHSIRSVLIIATLFTGCAATAMAQSARVAVSKNIPASSIEKPGDAGVRAHTNIQLLGPGRMSGTLQVGGPPFSGYLYESPASIACIYELQYYAAGCNPNVVTANPYGGSRVIAIVDAYDDPNAAIDLENFSTQFGVEAPKNFQVVYAPSGGTTPGSCTGPNPEPQSAALYGWDVEESLDIEWAHAMAPSATLYLVEAQTNNNNDLYCAVSVASGLVMKGGGGEVSMSWGGSEYSGETLADPIFTAPKVVYFAATGDTPGVIYPSTSPNVVAVGGTSLSSNLNTGEFELENTWQETGGGVSAYESRPSYQNGIADIVGSQRGVPDVAAVANLYTGVWVLDSLVYGPDTWYIVGGTSVATPLMAGIVNTAHSFSASSSAELTLIYKSPFGFNDVNLGTCGPYMADFAKNGWDFCSGRGSPRTYLGK